MLGREDHLKARTRRGGGGRLIPITILHHALGVFAHQAGPLVLLQFQRDQFRRAGGQEIDHYIDVLDMAIPLERIDQRFRLQDSTTAIVPEIDDHMRLGQRAQVTGIELLGFLHKCLGPFERGDPDVVEIGVDGFVGKAGFMGLVEEVVVVLVPVRGMDPAAADRHIGMVHQHSVIVIFEYVKSAIGQFLHAQTDRALWPYLRCRVERDAIPDAVALVLQEDGVGTEMIDPRDAVVPVLLRGKWLGVSGSVGRRLLRNEVHAVMPVADKGDILLQVSGAEEGAQAICG